MDIQKFIKEVKIPVRELTLRGQVAYVRALGTIERQESLVIADKWAKDRAKEMGKQGIERVDVLFDDENMKALKKYGIDTLAMQFRLNAVIALSTEDGKKEIKDVEMMKELTMGDGALTEVEVRAILKLENELQKESEESEAVEESEKNVHTSVS